MSCVQAGVRRTVVCLMTVSEGRGHWKCGSVQSFSSDMGTKGDGDAEAVGLATKEEESQGWV